MEPAPEDLPNLWKMMDSFQAQLGKVHESLSNPEHKKILGEVLSKLQEARAETEKTVPDSVQEMHDAAQQMKADSEYLTARVKQAQQDLEATMQEQAKKPASTPKKGRKPTPRSRSASHDVAGDKLRDELLRHGETGRGHSTSDEHEIWEDWTDSRDLAEPKKPRPKPPASTERPKEPPKDVEKEKPAEESEEGWTTEW